MSSNRYMWPRRIKRATSPSQAAPSLFKDLAIGTTVFTFSGERTRTDQTIQRGPWVKVSMWKYRHVNGGAELKVRSLRARVRARVHVAQYSPFRAAIQAMEQEAIAVQAQRADEVVATRWQVVEVQPTPDPRGTVVGGQLLEANAEWAALSEEVQP